ncbi:MAG: glycosyltransferase family 4 protein [Aquificae bacterium]|nr:glycosyltransferase family 4 protein [Aquificota bacterium]
MKVGLLSRWNAACGVSLHAEMIGRELLRRGHRLTVYAPTLESANRWWHHLILREDEPFVVRCYREHTPDGTEGYLNEQPVLADPPELFIVESYEKLPHGAVERLVRKLKDRGSFCVAVVHEGAYEELRYRSLDLFDAVVVFDERYAREVVRNRVKEEKLRLVPYPCYPVREGKRAFAEDGPVRFFSFGRQPPEEYLPYLRVLERFDEPFTYKVVRPRELLPVTYPWLVQERKSLVYETALKELHASDVHLLPKGQSRRVVLSSTLHQVLGSLTPTVVPDTRYFETLPKGDDSPVLFYRNEKELLTSLKRLVKDEELRERLKENARRFVTERELSKVANQFERLFEV